MQSQGGGGDGAYVSNGVYAGNSGALVGSGGAFVGSSGDPLADGGKPGAGSGLGDLGQDCVPGGLVTEAVGSPAKAVIQTLDRCQDGLACGPQGQCIPAPDCPSSGLCVFRHAALAENGGASGGSNAPGHAGAPWGGSGPLPVAELETGVVAITASESHVYWVEYGTRNALGDYQHDGALLSYSIADGTTTTLAAGLAGPMGLELTASHAYVYIDGAPRIDTPISPQLLRVPLSGGSAEVLQAGTVPGNFVAVGSRAFWGTEDQIYSMLPDGAAPVPFLATTSASLTSDATDLYYAAGQLVMRTPLASAAATPVGVSAEAFALHDDGIFSVETVTLGGMLIRAPKSGGPFQRVRALGAGTPGQLKVLGDRYFLGVGGYGVEAGATVSRAQVLTASFVAADPPVRLLDRVVREWPPKTLWAGTADALYWSEGQSIYKQPFSTP
jgi:hypothetical protein